MERPEHLRIKGTGEDISFELSPFMGEVPPPDMKRMLLLGGGGLPFFAGIIFCFTFEPRALIGSLITLGIIMATFHKWMHNSEIHRHQKAKILVGLSPSAIDVRWKVDNKISDSIAIPFADITSVDLRPKTDGSSILRILGPEGKLTMGVPMRVGDADVAKWMVELLTERVMRNA